MNIYHYTFIICILCGAGLGYGTSRDGELKDTVAGASLGLIIASILCFVEASLIGNK